MVGQRWRADPVSQWWLGECQQLISLEGVNHSSISRTCGYRPVNPAVQEAEAEEWQVQGLLWWPQREFKTSLGNFAKPYLKNQGWEQGCGRSSVVRCLVSTWYKALGSVPRERPVFPQMGKSDFKFRQQWESKGNMKESQSVDETWKTGRGDTSCACEPLGYRFQLNSTWFSFNLDFYHSLRKELRQNLTLLVSK